MMMAMRKYRAGEQVEQAWETALSQLQQRLANPPPPQPPPNKGPSPAELQLQAADLQERTQHNQGKLALQAGQQQIDKGHLLVDAFEAMKPDPTPQVVQ